MGAQGTAILDFGAFPGKSDASLAITGQAAIVSGSLVEAWMRLEASPDHTADEHMVETIKLYAGLIVAATGFTIYGVNDGQLTEYPLGWTPLNRAGEAGKGARIWGRWNVAWVWN